MTQSIKEYLNTSRNVIDKMDLEDRKQASHLIAANAREFYLENPDKDKQVFKKALEMFSKALEFFSDEYVLTERSICYKKEGQFENAMNDLNQALSNNNEYECALSLRAGLLSEQNTLESMEKASYDIYVLNNLRYDTDHEELDENMFFEYTKMLFKEYLNRPLKIVERQIKYYFMNNKSYFFRPEYPDGALDGDKLFFQGFDALGKQDYDNGVSYIESSVKSEFVSTKINAYAYAWLGLIQFLCMKVDEAIETLDKSISLDNELAFTHFVRGTIGYPVNTIPESFQKVIQLDPNNAEVLHKFGMTYLSARAFWLSEKVFEKAASIDPNNIEIRANVIYHRALSLGDHTEAKNLLNKFLQDFDNNRSDVLCWKGYICYKFLPGSHLDEAVKALEKSCEIERTKPTEDMDTNCFYFYAEALRAVDKREEARQAEMECIQLDPYNEMAVDSYSDYLFMNGQHDLALSLLQGVINHPIETTEKAVFKKIKKHTCMKHHVQFKNEYPEIEDQMFDRYRTRYIYSLLA